MRTNNKPTANIDIRNKSFVCLNCGLKQKIPFPIDIEMFKAMSRQFDKVHINCISKWNDPPVDLTLPVLDRELWWLREGEHGISSMTMFRTLCDGFVRPNIRELDEYCAYSEGHPSVPDDFRRCYLLIKAIPEWNKYLYVMKKVSPQWMQVIDNWDRLCYLLEELMKGKSNDMHEFMKKLGC